MSPIQQDRAPQDLRHGRARLNGEKISGVAPADRTLLQNADLDQLVVGERTVHGRDDPLRRPVLADVHDGIERMPKSAQMTGSLAGQFHGSSFEPPCSVER